MGLSESGCCYFFQIEEIEKINGAARPALLNHSQAFVLYRGIFNQGEFILSYFQVAAEEMKRQGVL